MRQLSARSYESSFVRDDNQLGTVASAELGHGAAHVSLGRGGRDDQLVSDLFVGAAGGNQRPYLAFAAGQIGQRRRRNERFSRLRSERGYQFSSDARRKQRFALRDNPDRL